jgi:hypothetical protein
VSGKEMADTDTRHQTPETYIYYRVLAALQGLLFPNVFSEKAWFLILNPFEDIVLVYSYFPFTTPGISY